MQLIAGVLAIFICIGVFSREFDKKTKWWIFIAAVGIALYITWR